MKYLEIMLAGSLSVASFAGAAFAAVVSFSPPTGQKIISKVLPPPTAKHSTQQVDKSPQATTVSRTDRPYLRHQLNLADQVPKDSEFWQFRQRLREAIDAHNAQYVRGIADDNIRLTFGYPLTLEDLKVDEASSPFWKHMTKTFAQGCATSSEVKSEEIWICPAIFEHWDEQVGYNKKVAVLGENVDVYAQPSKSSKVVGVLSNETVKLAKSKSQLNKPDGWIKVILPTGYRGYVSTQHVYHQFGHRAIFRKVNGEWKMTAFVYGD